MIEYLVARLAPPMLLLHMANVTTAIVREMFSAFMAIVVPGAVAIVVKEILFTLEVVATFAYVVVIRVEVM